MAVGEGLSETPPSRAVAQIRVYTVAPIYVGLWLVPALLLMGGRDHGLGGGAGGVTTAATVVLLCGATVLLRRGLRAYSPLPNPVGRAPAWLGGGLAGIAAAALLAQAAAGGDAWAASVVNAVAVVVGVLCGVVVPAGWHPAVVSATVAGAFGATQDWRLSCIAGAAALGAVVLVRLSLWQFDVLRRLELARRVESALAVAEERLRFSRDLHDVAGQALAAISLRTQIADTLLGRGEPERAGQELRAVADLAHYATREMRALAHGYGEIDLARELDGAEAILGAAGAECVMRGDSRDLSRENQVLVAWVVREAVTNILRHARDPRRVEVTITGAGVTIVNDGSAAARGSGAGGRGLDGLRERLAAEGADLVVTRRGDEFEVIASFPESAAPGSEPESRRPPRIVRPR